MFAQQLYVLFAATFVAALIIWPSKRAPRVSEALDSICLKALAADKTERYTDCNEMSMAL